MSALGQKQTFAPQKVMSALPPTTAAKQTPAKGYVSSTPKSGRVRRAGRCLLTAKSAPDPYLPGRCTMADSTFLLAFMTRRSRSQVLIWLAARQFS
jgi:hypothetical protein